MIFTTYQNYPLALSEFDLHVGKVDCMDDYIWN